MATYRVVHVTQYIYEEPASLSYNEARLSPRSFTRRLFTQTCLDHELTIEPLWSDHRERADFFGNRVRHFTIRQPHEQTTITAASRVRLEPTPEADQLPALLAHPTSWDEVRQHLQSSLEPASLDARQFGLNSPMVTVFPELASYARPAFPTGRPVLEAVVDLMRRIHQDFTFDPDQTTIATPLSEVLQHRRGVCQDFAHLMLGCLRAHGLAARYVSGYIETLPPPGKEKLKGADASHAWCSVFVPGLGWIDFDPTNNLVPHDQHITLSWGRDFADVTPLKGVLFSNGQHELKVAVDVERLEAS